MVLHTNTRALDYHPHIHAVVPGGGVDRRRHYWKKIKGDYLFKGIALAKVFRAHFLEEMGAAGLVISTKEPSKWVAHGVNVGMGEGALKYLSRYLYRGVISKKNIVSNHNEQVTFKYIESKAGETKFRTLPGEKLLHLIVCNMCYPFCMS